MSDLSFFCRLFVTIFFLFTASRPEIYASVFPQDFSTTKQAEICNLCQATQKSSRPPFIHSCFFLFFFFQAVKSGETANQPVDLVGSADVNSIRPHIFTSHFRLLSLFSHSENPETKISVRKSFLLHWSCRDPKLQANFRLVTSSFLSEMQVSPRKFLHRFDEFGPNKYGVHFPSQITNRETLWQYVSNRKLQSNRLSSRK